MHEETGLEVASYELFGTFSDPGRIARYPDGNVMQVVTIAYRVRVADVAPLRTSTESVALRFFTRNELPPDDLVVLHCRIVEHYLSDRAPPFLE